jgi:hypothetical protein
VRKLESKVGVLQIGYNKYWMQNASMMLSSPLLIELIYTRASTIFQPQSNETTNPPIHQSTNPTQDRLPSSPKIRENQMPQFVVN